VLVLSLKALKWRVVLFLDLTHGKSFGMLSIAFEVLWVVE